MCNRFMCSLCNGNFTVVTKTNAIHTVLNFQIFTIWNVPEELLEFIRFRESPGSNLGPETGYLDRTFKAPLSSNTQVLE
jgi:hypothetical protein